MEFIKTKISGLYLIQNDVFKDDRGAFIKTFRFDTFDKLGITVDLQEQFFSVSKKGVVRGMHFQIPPHDQNKLVSVSNGTIFDVICDIRKNSPTFGISEIFELSYENAKSLFIPKGLAHGFQALTETVTVHYQVSSMYSPTHEQGICFDSLGVKWPIEPAVTNERDKKFPKLKDYVSPFYF